MNAFLECVLSGTFYKPSCYRLGMRPFQLLGALCLLHKIVSVQQDKILKTVYHTWGMLLLHTCLSYIARVFLR